MYVTQVREKSGSTVVREETVACGAVMRWVDNPEQGNQFYMVDQQVY